MTLFTAERAHFKTIHISMKQHVRTTPIGLKKSAGHNLLISLKLASMARQKTDGLDRVMALKVLRSRPLDI